MIGCGSPRCRSTGCSARSPATAAPHSAPRARRRPAQAPARHGAASTPTCRGLPWTFRPLQRQRHGPLGEPSMALFTVVNHADQPVTGQAAFNVTPARPARYFDKIQCFCFTEQTLQPGETVEMPVIFFVDPDDRSPTRTRAHRARSPCPTRSSPTGRRRRAGQRRSAGIGRPTPASQEIGHDEHRGPRRTTGDARWPPRAEAPLPPGRSEPVAAGRRDRRRRCSPAAP